MGKTLEPRALGLEAAVGRALSRGGEAGDLSFDERAIDAADARELSRAKNGRQARLLRLIDGDKALFDPASQKHRQFQIRNEPVAAAQHVAGDRLPPSAV